MATDITTEKVDRSARSVLKKQAVTKDIAHRLFNSEDGRVVYKWLMDQFYHNQHVATEEAKLSRHAGRRDVMLLLRGIVEREKNEV